MSIDVYRETMGVDSDEELAASLKAIEEGLAEVKAGRTVPLEKVFTDLDRKYGPHG